MKTKNGTVFILLTALAFGTMEISLKIAGNSFSAFQLTFLRFLIGGILLLPLALGYLKQHSIHLTGSDWLYLLVLGLINICFSMVLFQIGVSMSNAGTAAIIFSVNPVFTMIFSHFIVNDRFNRKKAITLAISLIGLIIVADPKKAVGGKNMGIFITLLASAGFALYTTLGKLRISRIGGSIQNSFSFLLGSAVLLIFLVVRGDPIFTGINSHSIWPLLYVSFVVTGLGYVCYMKAIELCGPSTASFAFFIKPVVALVLSAIILSEKITPNVVFGMVLIIAGCTLAGPIERLLSGVFGHDSKKDIKALGTQLQSAEKQPLVITISRQFGSGGRDIGREVAKKLGISYYDTEIIKQTEKEKGFSKEFIEANEESVKSLILFDLYDQYINYASDQDSRADMLFKEETKVIKNLALAGSCVIVGRLANYILSGRENVFNVFISADIDWEAKRVAERDKISCEQAAKKIRLINKKRQNHCKYFTNTDWGNAQNYDLALKSSSFGIEKAAEMIVEAAKNSGK